jgi:hypothetical protein
MTVKEDRDIFEQKLQVEAKASKEQIPVSKHIRNYTTKEA